MLLVDSNDENNFWHKLLIHEFQSFIELLQKIEQSKGTLGRLLEPVLKTGLPLVAEVLKPLAKSI